MTAALAGASRQEVDAALSRSLERHRAEGGLIRVLRDSRSRRFFATLDVARVSQLDSNLLDEELVKLAREQVERAAKMVTASKYLEWLAQVPGSTYDFALRVGMWWFFTRRTVPTPGQMLQNLRYRNESLFTAQWQTRGILTLLPSSGGSGGNIDALTRVQRVGQLVLGVLLPFAFSRARDRLADGGVGEASEEWEERLDAVDKAWHLARLVNFVLFLVDGRYRTVTDRVLRCRLVPIKNECVRSVSFELMNQQLLFEGFTQFVLVLFPLVDWTALFRQLVRARNWVAGKIVPMLPVALVGQQPGEEQQLNKQLPQVDCGFCQQSPAVMPHRASPCQHVFCYYCIKSSSTSSGSSSSPCCPQCEQTLDKVERV